MLNLTIPRILRNLSAFALLLSALMIPAHPLQAQQPILVLQSGHHPNALAIRPDGQIAVTGGYDGLLKWWDRKTGLIMRTVVAHRGEVSTLSFNSDGSQLLSGAADGYMRIWDGARGTKLLEFPTTPGITVHAVFSPRGNFIASSSTTVGLQPEPPAIHLWDARTGRLINKLTGHTRRITRLDFNRAGDTLVSASDDHTLRIWSANTGALIRTITANTSGQFVAFSPEGNRIAASLSFSSPTRSELAFFDTQTGQRLASFADDDYWQGFAISANWRYFVATTSQNFKVWDVASRQLVRLQQFPAASSEVAIDADGATVALGGEASPFFWRSSGLSELQAEIPSLNFTTGLAFNRNGSVAWGSGNSVFIWDQTTARLRHVLEGHTDGVNEVAFSPDGNIIASCSNQEVKLWSAADGTPKGDLTTARPANVLEFNWDGSQSVAFSPDGKYLATGEIRVTQRRQTEYVETVGIRLWTLATRQMKLFQFPKTNGPKVEDPEGEKDPPYWIRSIAFSPDGRTLAADNGANLILLLDINTGTAQILRAHERPVNSVAFSPDGTRLVSASFDRTVVLWDVSTGRPLRTLKGHQSRVTSARFSPDGRTVVSGSRDRTALLWDVKSGEKIATFENHDEPVTFVGFSPDAKTIFTTGIDGKVNLWSATQKKLRATVVGSSLASWICFTPDGYYMGSNAEQYIGWRIGNAMYPATAYQAQFLKPENVLSRLNDTPVAVETPQIAQSKPSPTPVATPASRPRGGDIRVREPNGGTRRVSLYKNSYALLIGNSEYLNWNNLPGVLLDMVEVRDALKRQGFEVVKFDERGAAVFDQPVLNATRDEFKRQINLFIDEYGQDEDARLLIYYAGHGYSGLLPSRRKMGYLVMRDAPRMPPVERPLQALSAQQLAPFNRASINMDEIETYARNILCRHVIFVFDSCFAGTVLFRGDDADVPPYITAEILEPVREFLTAGNEYQKVLDDSAFRKAFVRGIEGAADAGYAGSPPDGYVLASELAVYIKQEVSRFTRNLQNPVFGKIPTQELARGDFIFIYGNPSNR